MHVDINYDGSLPTMKEYQVFAVTFNIVVFGLVFCLGVFGYGYFTWGQYRIVKKRKLANGSLSDQDQKVIERLKILRRKLLFVFLCFIGASALFVISAILHRGGE